MIIGLIIRLILAILLFISFCLAQGLKILPEFHYQYQSDSEEYHLQNAAVHDFEVGALGSFSNQKLSIQTYLAYHLIQGVNYRQSQFTSAQGLHFVSKDPGLGEDQRNYYISDLQIQYGDSSDFIYLNKWNKHWGPGVRSLTISNKIPTIPHFGFKWSVTDQIHFEYFHGQLKSNAPDSNYTDQYTLNGFSRLLDISRNIAGHRLDWQPHEKWTFSISEMVIYANRSLEMGYLLPFLPFFSVQNYLNDTDNILMSADLQYLHHKNLRFYGVFLMDEWSPPKTFDTDNHNWFAWQGGIDWKDIYFHRDQLRLEYTWTDHRIYHHRFEVNDYYSWGYPVGFWAGPHADEFYADYSFILGDNHIEIIFSNARRGEYTDSLRMDQYSGRPTITPVYERFGFDNSESCGNCIGTVESKQLMRLSVYRKLKEKLNIFVQYSYVNWKNAGFIPSAPQKDDAIPDIIKHSLGFGFRYQF